jgi:hypothetical protein
MRLLHDAAQPRLALNAETPPAPRRRPATCLVEAAAELFAVMERGQRLDAHILREAMTQAFGGKDSEGAWTWKHAASRRP